MTNLRDKVQETIDSLELLPQDAAAAALVIEYAAQIDRAGIIAARLAKLPVSEDNAEELARLRQRVSSHQVLVDLGPKIQAVLIELGATPRARVAIPTKPNRTGGKLVALRGGAA